MTTCSGGRHVRTKISPIHFPSKASLLPERVFKPHFCCTLVIFISSFYFVWIVGFYFALSGTNRSLISFLPLRLEWKYLYTTQPCCAKKIRSGLNTLRKSREWTFIVSSYCSVSLWLATARRHSNSAKIWARAEKIDVVGSVGASSFHHPWVRLCFALAPIFARPEFGGLAFPTEPLLRRLLQLRCLWSNDTFKPV